MKTTFSLVTFTPREVEAITGVDTTKQRDWRRRGFLPTNDGHARYDALSVSEIWLLSLLSSRLTSLEQAKLLANASATAIVWQALQFESAYTGDYKRAYWSESDVRGVRWQFQATWLSKGVMAHVVGVTHPLPRFGVLWANDATSLHQSLDKAFTYTSPDDKKGGPALVIDHSALGRMLLQRVRGPLVRVEVARPRGDA